MKIITIVGARPQFIKAGSLSRSIKKYIKKGYDLKEIIVHTGQHFDDNMSEVFFKEMQIPLPDYNLNINSLSHGAMTGRMLEETEKVIIKENPDWVVVFGDTNSTLAGALAAKKLHVKVAHIEAGLRSFNMSMPEEINRILTDRISDILFVPTLNAIENLKNEGYENLEVKIVNSGDIMLDGALYYSKFARKPEELSDYSSDYILLTVHRQENTRNPEILREIFDAVNEISLKKDIILPVHPGTAKKLKEYNITLSDRIKVIKPVGYFEMIWLIQNSDLVMTDSGGLQKEAYYFKKYCITLRKETEWKELIENGFNVLPELTKQGITSTYENFKFTGDFKENLYGGGNASDIITEELLNYDV